MDTELEPPHMYKFEPEHSMLQKCSSSTSLTSSKDLKGTSSKQEHSFPFFNTKKGLRISNSTKLTEVYCHNLLAYLLLLSETTHFVIQTAGVMTSFPSTIDVPPLKVSNSLKHPT